jgi:voltage-gated sodium channel type II alpha
MDYYDQEPQMENILSYLNYIFITIFSAESVIKLIAMNWRYFTIPWNVFDFVIVILSIAGLAFESVIKKYLSISPTVLRVVRVARVGRVLRLVKGARGIRTLLFALAVSLPALLNIGLLLFLIIFIYSIFGMNFFMHVGYSDYLTPEFNFETIYQSILTLFPLCTSAGWSTLLEGLSNDSPPKCNPNAPTGSQMTNGDCGSRAIAVPFLITFLILTFLIVINMYIAVILENFSQAREEVQQGLTDDDYDMYYEVWQRYDPKCTEFLAYDKLFDFVDSLDEPLKVPKPNRIKLISMNLTICGGDRIHCTDILDALTKNFLNAEEELNDDIANRVAKQERPRNYDPKTTTKERQRQDVCARIIVRALRRHIEAKHAKKIDDEKRPSGIAELDEFGTENCLENGSAVGSNKEPSECSTKTPVAIF